MHGASQNKGKRLLLGGPVRGSRNVGATGGVAPGASDYRKDMRSLSHLRNEHKPGSATAGNATAGNTTTRTDTTALPATKAKTKPGEFTTNNRAFTTSAEPNALGETSNNRAPLGPWEPLDEPLTPLQEITSFLSSLLTVKKLPWLAIRVVPVAMLAIAATVLWPSNDSDGVEADLALQTVNTLVPGQPRLADIEPGLNAEPAETPRLLVQIGPDGTPTTAATADTAADDTADGATPDSASADSQSEDEVPAESATAGATPGQAADNQTTTTATPASQTTRPTAVTSTTARPTTERPTTERPTTQAPTTAATTTTTEAPTTTTTQPPPTQPPATEPPAPEPPSGGNCPSGGEFEWLFRDDFNGSSVGGHWTQYNNTGNAGFGLRRSSANAVYDGKLVITAQMQDGALVSGGMSSGIGQTYGKWVFRVRTDNDPSQAVSGVVLTWPQSGVHPRDGENNIYETLVQTPNRNPFFTFIHKPFGSVHDQEYKQHNADASQWQTMTMEWTPQRITIIREGTGSRDVWTVNETGADLIPDVPHHMTIQLDGWKHSIGSPVRMEVDFVEIYKYCG